MPMTKIEQYLQMLGHKVKDKVTGQTGVATSITFDLYGCVQVIVNPGVNKDNKVEGSTWFDIDRLKVTSKKRVMDLPNFESPTLVPDGKKGPAEKPAL